MMLADMNNIEGYLMVQEHLKEIAAAHLSYNPTGNDFCRVELVMADNGYTRKDCMLQITLSSLGYSGDSHDEITTYNYEEFVLKTLPAESEAQAVRLRKQLRKMKAQAIIRDSKRYKEYLKLKKEFE